MNFFVFAKNKRKKNCNPDDQAFATRLPVHVVIRPLFACESQLAATAHASSRCRPLEQFKRRVNGIGKLKMKSRG